MHVTLQLKSEQLNMHDNYAFTALFNSFPMLALFT